MRAYSIRPWCTDQLVFHASLPQTRVYILMCFKVVVKSV
jgi:hypothetical protein